MTNVELTSEEKVVRTCRSCAHRNGTVSMGRCVLTGYFIEVERRYPTKCGAKFEGWAPRPGIVRRIVHFFKGVPS